MTVISVPVTSHRRIDPRRPLVLDTRELSRRPGSMRRVSKTVPAPAGLGTPLLAVPEGSDIALDLRLEAVMEGVLVSGTATATVTGECARCLDPVSDEVVVELRELYAYPERLRADEVDADDDDIGELIDDHADLEPAVRDALVLELPLSPRCDEDCAGLCPDCGVRLDDAEPDHSHERSDSRWAALASLNVGSDHPDLGSGENMSPHTVGKEKD